MPIEIIEFILDLIIVLLILSVGLGLYNWKRLSISFKYLVLYLCWNLLIEGIVVSLPPKTNNLPLLHLYTLFEFIFLTLLYRKMDLFENWSDKVFWIFLASISILLILNSAFVQDILSYNTYAKTLVQCILIAYAVGYIFQLKEKNPESGPLNLVNAIILVFYSGSLFVFMFGNILLRDEFDNFFWDMNTLLNLLFQILILISIWKACRVKKLLF